MNLIIKDIISQFSNSMTQYIMLAVCIDVFLGIVCAVEAHALNSTTSINGLFKQALIIIVPPLLHPILVSITGGEYFYGGFELLILLTVLLSIVENYTRLGLPHPEILERFIDDKKKPLIKSVGLPNKDDEQADEANKHSIDSTNTSSKVGDEIDDSNANKGDNSSANDSASDDANK